MSELNDHERDEIIEAIRIGRPLPLRYRASLFEDAPETELIWPGKTTEVERVVLPFQSIEHIDEPRSGTVKQPDLFTFNEMSGRQTGGWTNKLIWGDNKLVLSSLVNGPLRKQIDLAGGLKLVYIDPPFDVGADFSFNVDVGEVSVSKEASIVEEIAYRDTWGRGRDSYMAMLYERLLLIHGLLSDDGVIFVHVDWRVDAAVRLMLDEIFGSKNYRNTIIWQYGGKGLANVSSTLVRSYGTIFMYSKTSSFTPRLRSGQVSESVIKRFGKYMDSNHRITFGMLRTSGDDLELSKAEKSFRQREGREPQDHDVARDYSEGYLYRDIWLDIPIIRENPTYIEYVGYPTQKPEALLRRILEIGSKNGDLVADFFAGSGTTSAVAERLGRKWIAVDLGRFSIHTIRKRLIGIQRDLATRGDTYRAFELLNLGSYERQYFMGLDQEGNAIELEASKGEMREKFIELVIGAYGGQRSEQLCGFDGVKGSATVLIGPIDAPVTEEAVRRAIDTAKKAGITRVDILGFEFEMGIKPVMQDTARDEGITLTLRYIPSDVFDKRAIAKGQVKFYDVGYLEVHPKQADDGSVTVELKEFGVFYAQEDADAAASGLRNGASRIVVDGGQVVRVAKDKRSVITKEVLTKSWSDWIDYWAVDYDFESQREIIRVVTEDGEKDVWTGRYIFENQWQDFRTKDSRELTRVSDKHTYDTPGEYKIAVKVVDVFGNDTTKVVKFKVK